MRRAAILIVAGTLILVVAGMWMWGSSRERQVRADLKADVCELRDAVVDVLVLARASDGDSGFYDLSIARLHRMACP